MSKIEEERETQFTDEEKKQYATRLMRIRCTCGTKENYINIPTDHGVVAGEDQQPLLNANDHIGGEGGNIIHFGKCHSEHNPHRTFLRTAYTVLFLNSADIAEDLGIISLDCTPVVEYVWENVNEKHRLDGAPALLLGSCATCRYGGTIEFVKQDTEDVETIPQEFDSEEEAEKAAEEAEKRNIVRKETEALVAAAMDRIASTGEEGEQTVKDVQMYLLLAAVQSADPKTGIESYGIEEMIQDGWYIPRRYIPSQETIENNYTYNLNVIPSFYEHGLENGRLIRPGSLEDYRISHFDVSQAGSGTLAVHNVNQILEPELSVSLPDTIREMEPYGLLSTPYGLATCGFKDYFYRNNMQMSYEVTDIASGIGAADAGIIMYATWGNIHYVACRPNEDGTFDFYDTEYEQGKQTMQFEEFMESLGEEDLLGMAALAISKGENQ